LAASSPIFATATDQSGCQAEAFAGMLPAHSDSSALIDQWDAEIAAASERFALPASWIRAVIDHESRGIPIATSPVGAMGLMQIMPSTWAALRGRYRLGDDPYQPRDNIAAGAAYMRELFDRYGAPGFLAAYSAGPERLDEYLLRGRPLPAETQRYVASLTTTIIGAEDRPPVSLPVLDQIRAQDRVATSNVDGASGPLFARSLRSVAAEGSQRNGTSSAQAGTDDTTTDAATSGLFVVSARQGGGT
jgi:hypothetical protein